jgi:hypothetical protein
VRAEVRSPLDAICSGLEVNSTIPPLFFLIPTATPIPFGLGSFRRTRGRDTAYAHTTLVYGNVESGIYSVASQKQEYRMIRTLAGAYHMLSYTIPPTEALCPPGSYTTTMTTKERQVRISRDVQTKKKKKAKVRRSTLNNTHSLIY